MAAPDGIPALGGLDAVEIKLNFDPDQIEDALRVFGFNTSGKQRRIWFGEILDGEQGPDALPLLARGVILRVRAKNSSGDVTVKLRCPDGGIDIPAWRDGPGRSRDAKIEGDWASKRLVSASLSHDLDEDALPALNTELPPIEPLLSETQRDLATQVLVPTHQVRLLGPIQARKWDAAHDGDVEAELWEIDAKRFLEISLRVTDDPVAAVQHLQQRATTGGLDITAAGQDTKTTTVLQHLAKRVHDQARQIR
jgi:hypothetical protein